MAEESRTKLLNVLFGLNTSVEFEHIDEDLLVDDRKKTVRFELHSSTVVYGSKSVVAGCRSTC